MLLPFALFALAQIATPAPDPTLPPGGVRVLVTAEGRGVQIYHCAALPDNKFQWRFDAPLATLYQPGTNTMLGTHTQGPSWVWNDGSAIRGTVAANNPAPGAGDVPWLLIKAQPTSSHTSGMLAQVLWVRRSETKGGTAPTDGCDADHASAEQQVPYTATYTFYAATAKGHR